ncbi:lipocalin family protein [uncultured Wocania sp.]|uniref:lipocalin family protein n=1 Tax=uncultured Wocania sp. TaxID=2834404 RepID=UPI0030FCC002
MRKLSILFIMLTAIFTSCNTESVDVLSNSEDIVGIWKGITLDYNGKTVTNAQGQIINADFIGEAYDMNYTLTFNENPNIIVSEGSYSIKLTTTVLGQTSTQDLENIEFLEAETWSQNNNTLTVSGGGKSYDYKIVKLTENELKLSVSTEEDLSQQGVSILTTVNAIMSFSKQ